MAISYWAFYLTKFPSDQFKMFATFKEYNVVYNGRRYKNKVTLYQTSLIDVIYEVIKYNQYGLNEISPDQALFLVNLYLDMDNSRTPKKRSHTDFMFDGLNTLLILQK